MDDDPIARAAGFAALGLGPGLAPGTPERLAAAVDTDPDPRARAAALGALVRGHAAGAPDSWQRAARDAAPAVRRRAAEVAPLLAAADRVDRDSIVVTLVGLLDDAEVTVVEAAAWALGELGDVAVANGAVAPLARVTTAHPDALAREGAVAALGALGSRVGLDAILTACSDKPAVRRRAVLALASFDGPDVEAALDHALEDRDWQVRQAAEDLRRT